MPKKSSSPSKKKIILILIIGLIIGIGATFSLINWSNKRTAQKNQELIQNEVQMGKLFTEIEQSPIQMGELADQNKIAEATALGEEMQVKMDQVLELNQTLIDNTKDRQKELSLKKQEIFQLQKQILETMIRAVNLKDFKGSEAQAIQQELTDFGAQKKILVAELQAIMTGE